MKIGNFEILIKSNSNNRFWNPLGLFHNTSFVKINEEWYNCWIKFIEKDNKHFIQLINPMKVDKESSLIKEFYLQGIYAEIEVSKFNVNLLKYKLNSHNINYKSYRVRKIISERRKTVYIFLTATILSLIYYFTNEMSGNYLMKYISENNLIQTLIIFLTISSFINIFYPFTLKKELDKKDIEKIINETLEENKLNEEIKKRASF